MSRPTSCVAQAKADASAVDADKAAVDAARVQLQYTDIVAPIDARTGALMINLGNLVKANDTPFLVQLNQVTPIYVTFSVPEANLEQVRQRFSCRPAQSSGLSQGTTGHPAEGRLTFIDNGVDMTTGMVKLKATFANKDRRSVAGRICGCCVGALDPEERRSSSRPRRFKTDSKANTSMSSSPTARLNRGR